MTNEKYDNFSWVDPLNDASNINLKYAQKVFSVLSSKESVELSAKCPQPVLNKDAHRTLNRGSRVFKSGGTSGVSSQVFHDEASIRNAVSGLQQRIGFEPISSLCCLPLTHVGGWMQIERAKYTKGSVLFANYKQLSKLDFSSCLHNRWISLVPTQLHFLLQTKQGRINLRCAKGIFTGGSKITDKDRDELRTNEIPVFPCYGMSETAGMITLLDSSEFLNGINGVGECLPSAQIKLDGKQVTVKTKNLCYRRNSTFLTASHWFKTNDEALYIKGAGYQITGRTDRTINTGGEKVIPQEIEDVILSHPDVLQCLVVGQSDDYWVERIVCYLVLRNDSLHTIKDFTRKRLLQHQVPKEWKKVCELPLSDMGKVISSD